MPKKFCRYPRCGNLLEIGSDPYCVEHRRFKEHRGPAAVRGYDWRWHKFRDWFLNRHPLCELCKAKGIVKAADLPHHLIPLKGKHDPNRLVESNCSAVCVPCHRQLTLEQKGGETSTFL